MKNKDLLNNYQFGSENEDEESVDEDEEFGKEDETNNNMN